MDQPLYHVMLQGRRVGPYDRRTIVGMRIKKALTSSDVVLAGNGQQLTVADLVKMGQPDGGFEASRSGSYSVIQAVHSAALVEAKGVAIPKFKDEIEVRLQTKDLRISGRFRTGVGGWKEDRVKIPLSELVHSRARGSIVELALRQGHGPLQRLVLELFTPESAVELVGALPVLAPWPESHAKASGGPHPMVWGAVVGTALIVGSVLVWVLTHRA